MAITRRWLQSAVEESKKPTPKMPWQERKLVAVLSKTASSGKSQNTATA